MGGPLFTPSSNPGTERSSVTGDFTSSVVAVLGASFVRGALSILILSTVIGVSFGKGGLLPGQAQFKGILVPICIGSNREPVAIFRAKHVFSDYQRRGFFRIGVLPLLVIDGLSIELRDPSSLPATLNAVPSHALFKDFVRSAVEARQFALSCDSQKDFAVRARLVRLESSDEWRLEDGVVRQSGGGQLSFQRATLRISGPHAGEMNCETSSGVVRIELLSSTQPKNSIP